jgi:hypothetical protein
VGSATNSGALLVGRRTFLKGLAAIGFGSAGGLFGRESGYGVTLDGVMRRRRLQAMLGMWESPVVQPGPAVSVGLPSTPLGTPISVLASSDRSETLELAIVRVGWYEGQGTETLWSGQVNVDTLHRVVVDVPTGGRFTDGLYLVVARSIQRTTQPQFHPFVVTNASSDARVVVQLATFTYQAYNAWGGQSLYAYNSTGATGTSIAINRPYDIFDGLGFLLLGDLQLVQWLDRSGYSVTFATNFDTHRNQRLMDGRALFVTNFHDEYWTSSMRDNLEGWVANGVHAAFLSANSIYWQAELDLDPVTPTLLCSKDPTHPSQYLFRSPQVGRPEAALLGAAYDSFAFPYGRAFDWVVEHSDHWLYAGTGLRNGDRIKRVIGYEWDRFDPDTNAGGVTVLAGSTTTRGRRHNATIAERLGRGTVVNVGTTYWSRLLTGGGHWKAGPDRAVEQMTTNLLHQLG